MTEITKKVLEDDTEFVAGIINKVINDEKLLGQYAMGEIPYGYFIKESIKQTRLKTKSLVREDLRTKVDKLHGIDCEKHKHDCAFFCLTCFNKLLEDSK